MSSASVSSRSKLTIASSSRSRCTGTPRTVPDAAQATAASSSSCGGSPSPWMQLRRAAPPRGSSASSSSSSATQSTCRTACTSTTKPKPCSRASCGSWRPATTTSHGLSASLRHSTSRLQPPLAAAQPVAQLAARAGAPRNAYRLEPAQSRSVRLLKRGLQHIWARHRGRLLRRLLWRRRRESRLGERCRQLRLAHVVLRAEVRAQLLDALASQEANVQLTGGSAERAGRIEIVGA
eukprot:scaffold6811_cov55-Phaeocystis_antarctica.AAC.8